MQSAKSSISISYGISFVIKATSTPKISAKRTARVSCVELLFPPTATLPQIKFGFSYILSILACCFLRHVFICPLDHSFSFPYSLFVTNRKRERTALTKVRSFSSPIKCCKAGPVQGHALINGCLSYKQSLRIVMLLL